MSDKPKCKQCNERDVFSKGLCSHCYGINWRLARKAEREAIAPKQLTAGDAAADAIQGEIVQPAPAAELHLVARNPIEMQAAQAGLKVWLEQKLVTLEHDIVEANAALAEAKRNKWATAALTSARNRAVDDETFYNKILGAVEAGYTIIPDFPISVFAVRISKPDGPETVTYTNHVNKDSIHLGRPISTDCAPAGAGEYVNYRKDDPNHPYRIHRTGDSAGPISFPSNTARSPIMQATSEAMVERVFDQFGVCFPVINAGGSRREVQTNAARAGDPLVIGQVLRKRVGSKQKTVSFIIAWYLNVNEL